MDIVTVVALKRRMDVQRGEAETRKNELRNRERRVGERDRKMLMMDDGAARAGRLVVTMQRTGSAA